MPTRTIDDRKKKARKGVPELRANHYCWVNQHQRNEIKRIAERMHAQPAIIAGARTVIFDGSDVLDTVQGLYDNPSDRLTFAQFKAALIAHVAKRTKITPDRLGQIELTIRDLEERIERLEGGHEGDAQEEKGKWVPKFKVGDYVVRENEDVIGVCIERSSGHFGYTWVQVPSGLEQLWGNSKCRPATQAEIDAHLEQSAYGDREGLFEGAACEDDPVSLQAEVADLGVPISPVGANELYVAGLSYFEASGGVMEGVALYGKGSYRQGKVTKLSRATFLRLANLTAASLKAKKEEEELRKVPVFGQRVEWKDVGGNPHEGVWISEYEGTHWLGIKGCAGSTTCDRKDFTILNN